MRAIIPDCRFLAGIFLFLKFRTPKQRVVAMKTQNKKCNHKNDEGFSKVCSDSNNTNQFMDSKLCGDSRRIGVAVKGSVGEDGGEKGGI